MDNLIPQNDVIIQFVVFISVLCILVLFEHLVPRRNLRHAWLRKINNLVLLALDVILIRLIIPVTLAGFAGLCLEEGWGLFNQINIGLVPAIIASIFILDMAIYAQHVLLHHVNLLWKIHRVHHTDMDIDVSTGVRFHPLEIILSAVYKMLIIFLLGPPVIAVVTFEIILFASAMFNHSNVYIPEKIDRWLRYLIVTPDMHRVHHSVYKNETNSNYGFFIPWWDRLFRTYLNQPSDGHLAMKIGLNEFRDNRSIGVQWLLLQPFLTSANTGGIKSED